MPFSDYKVALVTGASAGMGEAIVERLCQEGIVVHAVARRHEQLAALADRTGCIPHAVDVGDLSALTELCRDLQVDILVNNAGVSHPGSILDAEADWINTQVDVNLRAVLHLCRLLVPGMVARDCGHVINITSIAAIYNFNGNSIYHATKAGVHALSRQLRVDCYGKRVRITEICPGGWRRRFSAMFPAIMKRRVVALSRVSSCRKQKTSPTAWLSRSPRRWRSTSAILRSPRRCRYPVGYPRCVPATVSPE